MESKRLVRDGKLSFNIQTLFDFASKYDDFGEQEMAFRGGLVKRYKFIYIHEESVVI